MQTVHHKTKLSTNFNNFLRSYIENDILKVTKKFYIIPVELSVSKTKTASYKVEIETNPLTDCQSGVKQ